jgi:hypothetical protein
LDAFALRLRPTGIEHLAPAPYNERQAGLNTPREDVIMRWAFFRQNCRSGLAIVIACRLLYPAAGAVETANPEVRIVADKLSIHARNVPLREILQQFQDAGVRVRMDTRINPTITTHFDNKDMYQALAGLFSDCDYGLVWSRIDGPAGPMKRISQIDVFKSGDRSRIQPLPGGDGRLKRQQEPIQDRPVMVVKDEVLIRLRPGTSLAAFQALLARIGGTAVSSIPALGIYRIHLTPGSDLAQVLKQLAASPEVEAAEPNLIYKTPDPNRGAGGTAAPRKTALGRPGQSAAVAVLDTGLMGGVGLGDAVVATLDAFDPERPITDSLGHGTQMALIASGAVTPMGMGEAADAVPVVSIKAFDDNGYASSFEMMRSMLFSLDQNARVISLSWGSETDSRFVSDAVTYATSHGAVVVAAAGNEPTGRPYYPAALANVIAVSALTPTGETWPNSNYGDFVTLAAPAYANLPVGYKGPAGSYAGTSIATAYTANALGRYFALHPDATAAQAVAALTRALTPVTGTRDTRYGKGKLDQAALAAFLK